MIISFPSCRLKILMLIVIPLQGEPLKLKTRVLLFERDKLDGGMGFLTFLNEGFLFLSFFSFFLFFPFYVIKAVIFLQTDLMILISKKVDYCQCRKSYDQCVTSVYIYSF